MGMPSLSLKCSTGKQKRAARVHAGPLNSCVASLRLVTQFNEIEQLKYCSSILVKYWFRPCVKKIRASPVGEMFYSA